MIASLCGSLGNVVYFQRFTRIFWPRFVIHDQPFFTSALSEYALIGLREGGDDEGLQRTGI